MEAILDPKTQLLVALGAAVAARCQHCFATLYGAAEKAGVEEREVRAAVAIATTVAAKAQEFMAVFVEQTSKGAIAAGASGAGCGCA